MKHSLFFILIILILSGCKKDETPTLYMSGYIYDNCYDRTPLRNGRIRLFRTKYGANQQGKVVAYDSTDANGYFKIFFPPDTRQNWMKLQTGNGNDLMQEIPPTGNMENVEVFATVFSNIKVSLNIINPHNLGDTFIIKRLANPPIELKIPCPLSSGFIYTAFDYSPINPMGFDGTEDYLIHGFKPSTGFSYSTNFKIDKYCGDTVNVIVDIK